MVLLQYYGLGSANITIFFLSVLYFFRKKEYLTFLGAGGEGQRSKGEGLRSKVKGLGAKVKGHFER